MTGYLQPVEIVDSESDAEGEEADDDYEHPLRQPALATTGPPKKIIDEADSELDAEGEIDIDVIGSAVDEDVEEANGSETTTSNSNPESEDNGWQEDSDNGDEDITDDKMVDSNLCIYCGESEEKDPSEVYEEYLECQGCSRSSHRECARNQHTFKDDKPAKNWKCGPCQEEDESSSNDEDESARGIVRESKCSDAVSGAEQSSESDDITNGMRSRRKRKIADMDSQQRDLRKRRKTSASSSATDTVDRPLPRSQTNGLGSAINEQTESLVRPSRLRRLRKFDTPLARIHHSDVSSIIVIFNLNYLKMQRILRSRPKKNKWRERNKKIQAALMAEPEQPHYPPVPGSYSSQFYGFDRESEDKSKPYGGILTEAEADISKTFPQLIDRKRFEQVRIKAEEEWERKMVATNNAPEPTKPSQKMSGPPSKIKCINFGGFEIDTWNAAPYPEEYSRNKVLYICQFCLKYMNSDYVAWRHKLKCPAIHPPGDEIYRDANYSFFEVDGRKNPAYCQNLCLLAKLFLGSKTLYYDVEPFLFYIMTENDDLGCHFVGYFSKEKRPSSMNNVSCILVLPIYQRRGFGHMLIEFSYLLTRREQKTGSPEKPLSDMGLVSYRGYWRLIMCYHLVKKKGHISITDLTKATGMTADDVVSALEGLRALVRDPVTRKYALRLDYEYYKDYIDKYERKNYPKINPDSLIWTKYLMNRGLSLHYEGGGPLHTVAPRDDGGDDAAEEADVEQDLMDLEIACPAANAENDVDMVDASLTGTGIHAIMGDLDKHDANRVATKPQIGDEKVMAKVCTPFNLLSKAIDEATPVNIPLSRYELIPPVPGLGGRKRGRPPGKRNTYAETPGSIIGVVSSTPSRAAVLTCSPLLTRTRSGLGNSTLDKSDIKQSRITEEARNCYAIRDFVVGVGPDNKDFQQVKT